MQTEFPDYRTRAIAASILLLVALAAPCALPNRIVAACSLVVALLTIGSVLYTGYRAITANRRAMEKEAEILIAQAMHRASSTEPAARMSDPRHGG